MPNIINFMIRGKEAKVRICSLKYVFLKILHYSNENTRDGVSF